MWPTMREVEDELEAVRSKKTKADDTMVSGNRGGAASSETIRRMSNEGGTTTSTEAIGTSSTMQYSVEMELALLGEMPR